MLAFRSVRNPELGRIDSKRLKIDSIAEMQREDAVHLGRIAGADRVEDRRLGEIFQEPHAIRRIDFFAVESPPRRTEDRQDDSVFAAELLFQLAPYSGRKRWRRTAGRDRYLERALFDNRRRDEGAQLAHID